MSDFYEFNNLFSSDQINYPKHINSIHKEYEKHHKCTCSLL